MIYHSFYVVNSNKISKKEIFDLPYESLVLSEEVKISDDTIRLIFSTLLWVDTLWSNMELLPGLSYHGDSIIDSEQLIKMGEIVTEWVKMLENAPSSIEFGTYVDEKNKTQIEYFERKVILSDLNNFLELTKYAKKQNKLVLYSGI